MAEMNIELMHYRDIRQWRPAIGDIVIKHGWVNRTKWFGVINSISPDGQVDIIKDGSIKLLASTVPAAIRKKRASLAVDDIKGALTGSYVIMQQDPGTNAPVWYF